MNLRRSRTFLLLFFVLLSTTSSVIAQSPSQTGLSLKLDAGGVVIRWTPDSAQRSALSANTTPPQQLIALRLPNGADATPQLIAVSHYAWGGTLPISSAPQPLTLPDGTTYTPLPDFKPQPPPTAPLTLLRDGMLRGQRIVVYALNPVYLAGSGPVALSGLSARIPAATTPGSDQTWLTLSDTPFLTGAPTPNPIAAGQSWTIRVTNGGIQALSAGALQAAGLSLAGLDPARLRVWHAGAALPLELRTSAGALSELRFYAPDPGDRYNSADTYWLTIESAAGPTIGTLDATPPSPPSVPCQTTALGRGVWRVSASYDSRLPGPDGDHFFVGQLRVGQAPAPVDTATATLSSSLPQATAPTTMTLTVAGASLFDTTHTIRVTLAGVQQTAIWFGTAVFSQSLSFAVSAGQAEIALIPPADPNGDGLHLDSVAWETPVQLKFGLKGAVFVGQSGLRCYALSDLPTGATLYDVSTPTAPLRLNTGASSFEVNESTAHTYLLAGPGTLQTPAISAHAPVNLATPLNVQAIYIAPDAFVSTLAPLVAQRQAQGYSVAVVRAQAIYDSWSGGQMSPQAIRDFLRYAAETWAVKPIAVTLVGDGESDPRNYLRYGHTTWIPPYLVMVDSLLGEAACENCFAQLNGNSPLDDPLPDLMIGRLPVKSVSELSLLVQKIIAYENSTEVGAWRGTSAYVTDNADQAGDFSFVADQSIADLPAAVRSVRMYYDPADPSADQFWRVKESYAAFLNTMSIMNSGEATLSFIGHGSPYQWAYTGPPLSPSVPQDRQFLLNVDFAGDLRNDVRLPIVLSLSCLTGQFQVPSWRGTTIDEALVVNPYGGAIATWSSAGLGVVYGHGALQSGFLGALWSAPAGSPPVLGALTLAGYQRLFTTTSCCQESLRTYGLLGDPLTPARVQTGIHEVMLPIVRR
jgi:hypothetical protein